MVRWDSDAIRIANRDRDLMLRRFAENAARHGTDMWVHAAPIEELCAAALKLGQAGTGARSDDPIVAVCEYRDGGVIDLVRVVH